MELNLMVQCCIMNGYCHYSSPPELYLMFIVTILVIIMITESINNCIRRY